MVAPAFFTNFLEKRKFKKTVDEFVDIMQFISNMNENMILSAAFLKKEFKLHATRKDYKDKLANLLILHNKNIKDLNAFITFARDFMQKNKFSEADTKKYKKILSVAEESRDLGLQIQTLLTATPTPKKTTPKASSPKKSCANKKKANCKTPCNWTVGKGCK